MNLVLNTYGTALYVENGLFTVSNKDNKQRIAPSKVRRISISKGARISSDAALLAIENEVEILFVDRSGKPAGRVWSVKYGSISTIRRKQLSFTSSAAGLEWIKSVVVQKIDNQQALLFSLHPQAGEAGSQSAKVQRQLADYKAKIQQLTGESVTEVAPSLRGWEGAAIMCWTMAL